MDDFKVTTSRRGGRSFNDHDDRTVSHYDDGGYRGGGRSRGRGRGRGRGASRGGGGFGGYRGSTYKTYTQKYRGRGRQDGLDNIRQYSSRGGRKPWRGRGGGGGGYKDGGDSGPNPRSRLEEDEDGDFDMGAGASAHSRRTPYERPQSRRSDQSAGADYMRRLGLPVGDGDGYNSRDTYSGRDKYSDKQDQWHRIMIPYGKSVPKDWILQSINNLCEEPFVPVNFNFEQQRAQFYVQGRRAAQAIRNCSRKIIMPSGSKMIIEMAPTKRAPAIHDIMDDGMVEKLKVVMSGRYDPALKALDLSDMFHDKELNKEGIHLSLSRLNVITKVMEIIADHIPEMEALNLSTNRLFSLDKLSDLHTKAPNIKSISLKDNDLKADRDLDALRKLPIEELNLEGNPLCDRFEDERAYVSCMRKKFPKVVKLDGHALPPPIKFELDTDTPLPTSKGSHFYNDQVKNLVCLFLKQYFELFDSDKRESLMDAYHETAIFSFSWFYNDLVKHSKGFQSYPQESRNMMKVFDSHRRQKALKSGKLNIVAYLTQMPKTQHDPSSLVIDVTHTSDRLLCFTVNGIFKETDAKHEPPIRSFSRIFVTIPQGSGIVIINEQLTITNPSQEQVKKSFRNPAPTPSSSPVLGLASPGAAASPVAKTGQAGLTDIQQQMVAAFSTQSGMNAEWSAKCLAQNDWNYDKAGQVFTDCKGKGQIPPEAFIK